MIDKISDSVKLILEIADRSKNLDLKSAILDLKENLLALREENFHLKEKLSHKVSFNMVFEHSAYVNKKEDGSEDGPYCTKCWDDEGKAIRLQFCKDDFWKCPKCNEYIDRSRTTKTPPHVSRL